MEDIFKDMICFLLTIIAIIIISNTIYNNLENNIELDSYFIKHKEEFIITNYYIGNTRHGYNKYHVIAKNIKNNNLYDYEVNINDYIKLGGKLNNE